jgi:hypothetical protein
MNAVSPPPRQSDSSFTVIGALLNTATGYPIQGLTVNVYFLEPQVKGNTRQEETLLGTAQSTIDGTYRIVWIDSPVVSQKLCLLTSCPRSQFILKVSEGPSKPKQQAQPSKQLLLISSPTSATSKTMVVNLSISIPEQILTNRDWTVIGKRMQTAGLTRLSDLTRQLVILPPSQSLFREWSPIQRQNAVAQLEKAFLDPQGTLSKISPLPSWQQLSAPNGLENYRKSLGDTANQTNVQEAFAELRQKVSQFSSISAVDWIVDPAKFTDGPAGAITANQSNYFGALPYPTPPPGPIFGPPPELGYRDYLRTQWTSMASLQTFWSVNPLSEPQSEEQLRNRFHQDFRTQDTSQKVANEILIPILTEILTAPTGSTFGFGIAPNQIPLRGISTPARQYLDTLVGLSAVSAQELTLRYRTDFIRPDTVMSNAVWENIYTLQGFYRDSFQSVVDPADTSPDALGQPIIPTRYQGTAPFFLEYGEWLLLQQPIPFENYFQIRQIFQINVTPDHRQELQNFATASSDPSGMKDWYQFYVDSMALQDQLLKVYQSLDQNEYRAALDILGRVPYEGAGLQYQIFDLLTRPIVSQVDVLGQFANRRKKSVASMDELQKLLTLWQIGNIPDYYDPQKWEQWASFNQVNVVCSLVYLYLFTIPFIVAQASLALGDWPTAMRYFGWCAFFLVGKATSSDTPAYRDINQWADFTLYSAGNLPYTVDTAAKPSYPSLYDDDSDYIPPANQVDYSFNQLIPSGIHPIELRFFHLHVGEAMLEWADTLYRTDDASNISRARELYKGVYYLHGATPPINPSWTGTTQPGTFFNGTINPAQASQLARAELGFTQINVGLNFFGFEDNMVPLLRYSTLKSAADNFATEAKSAEQDFLNYMQQLENATIETMKESAMLQRANLQAQIAEQQAGIAQDQITQAQILITQVNQQIQSIQQTISDHDSFFGQLGDYFSGMGNIVKGLPSFFTSGVGSGVAAEAGFGSADTAGLLGLGAGASVTAGFGAFAVASYMTLSSMASAQNQRESQLSALENQNLPSAQMQLNIAQRSVTIANLNQQVANSDAELATQLLVFAEDRYLSVEFWSYLATLLERVLRQYLDLGTKMGWLAQRALSYEQNMEINIVRMDYFPAQQQGAGGADQLLLDLADLEAQHLDGLQEMIPVKHTFSLVRDFPLQFAQLLNTGQCVLQTSEQPMQLAYPGTYAYRVVAVTPTLSRIAATSPVRGLLSNPGVSQISSVDGSKNPSIRPADALPISEFNLGTTDMQIYGLPGGTLMQFEGSGVETLWKLEFPTAANPSGLSDIADVLITLDLRAQFSPSLYQTQLKQLQNTITRFVLVSAYKLQLSGLSDLQGKANTATIDFDLTALGLPAQEQKRLVNNLAILLIGAKNVSVNASLKVVTPPRTIPVTLVNGAAFSNAPPITDSQSTVPLSPLNVLAGISVDQSFSLMIDKGQNPGVDFSKVQDVIFGIDYTATV